ncbi:E3 ubiquitin-protein ligase PUB23 [Apostasia shenzhenica]|uniref:U-box domain-containing protein n=1 Tax=Apostasia shenzhenica TaxID=1088818 RepID=A0A2I0AS06_9ASPA|nr:E3 ubiquitin-protein ligase PUB23 [Apostasia shenzhenica]
MAEVEVPCFFLCPISLQMMRDPVTLPTGITYDRESIERWISSGKSATCPATNQPLPSLDLTPNHTLRRLIQAWCAANAANGVDRIPVPQISILLDESRRSPEQLLASLRRLREIAAGSDADRQCLEASGVVEFLASLISGVELECGQEEALGILCSLQISEHRDLVGLISFDSLTAILLRGSHQSRAHAAILLSSMISSAAPSQLVGFTSDHYRQIVNVLTDRTSKQATKSTLQLLVDLCPLGRNRVKAAKAGAAAALVDLLLEEEDRRTCEMALIVLDKLCGCAEGRAGLVGHGAGIAVVSKKVLRVSPAASDRAVRILQKVTRFSPTAAVLREMLQVGAVAKLCLVLQVDCGVKEKRRAKEILRIHGGVWRNSPCWSSQFLRPYPSSSRTDR